MNPVAEKFEAYLARLHEEQKDSGWLREAISEIQRLEKLLLEERMKVEAFSIELNKKLNPAPSLSKRKKRALDELFKAMGIR